MYCNQYLNSKISLLQPWPNFNGNYVIPSPQLKCFSPKIRWRPKKKGLRRKLKCFFLEIKWRPKKKKKKKGLHRNLGLYSAGICRIYSCWLALDRFIIQRSNLDGRTRVVSRAGLFGSGSGLNFTKISGLIRTWDVLFVLGAQKHNQNNLAKLLNFSDLT